MSSFIAFIKTKYSAKYPKLSLLAAILFLLPAAYAFPNIINMQGKLTDPQFNALSGTHNFTFTVYNALTGGTARYSENISLNMTQGLWSHQLGSNNTINLAFDEDYYIEVRVNGQTMAPRLRLGVAGYTYRSNYSERVDNVSAGGNASGNFFVIRNLTVSNNVLFVDNATARVGILTTSPTQPLDVRGNVNVTGGSIYILTTAGTNVSNGTIILGSTARDGLENITFDTSLGNNGKFVFSAPLQVEASSPGITFYDATQPANLSRQQSIIFNYSNTTYPISFSSGVEVNGSLNVLGASPATITFGRGADAQTLQFDSGSQEFKFSGGKIRQDFVNLIRNGGFESFSAGTAWSGNQQAAIPDGWSQDNGTSYQYAPASYSVGTDIFQGYNALKLDPAGGTNFGKVSQTILAYRLQPNKTYSVGVWIKTNGTATAKLNITGSALLSNFTEQFNSSTTSWILLKGQFTTKASLSSTETIVVELKVSGSPGHNSFFDAVQLNTGNVLGEYQDSPIREVGDQTIYGGLRLQRTGFDRGGVLTVDKSVRTRQIEFSPGTDPGWGGLDTNYFNDPRYNWGSAYTQQNVFMELGGGFSIRITSPASNTSELSFRIDSPGGPVLTTTTGKTITIASPANITGKLNASAGVILHDTKCSAGQVLSTTADGTVQCVTDAGGSTTTLPYSNLTGTIVIGYNNLTGTITLTAANVSAGTFPAGKFAFTGTATTNALEVNGSVLVVNGTTGNVGIGTSTPAQTLSVVGTANVSGAFIAHNTKCSAGQVLSTTADGTLQCVTDAASSGVTIPIDNVTNRHYNVLVNQTNITSGITLPSSNVTGGLDAGGVTIPANNVTAGTFPSGKFVYTGTATTNALEVNGSVLVVNGTTGRVGIAAASPASTLDVGGAVSISGTQAISSGRLFQAADGAAGGAAFASASANNLGMFFVTSGIGFSTLGFERMRISSAGLVGINTTAPSGVVQVNVNGSDVFHVNETGRIGLGTASPLQTLTVVGTANVTGALIAHNTKCSAGQVLSTTADGTLQCVTDASGSTTTLPYTNLTGTITLTADNVTAGTFPAGAFVFTGTATNLALNVNNTLYVNGTTGRVGVGIAAPNQTLTVIGTANVTGALIAHNTKCSAGQVLSTTADGTVQCVTDATGGGGGSGAGWSNTSTLVFNDTVNVSVAIGKNATNTKLHVEGDVNVTNTVFLNGSLVFGQGALLAGGGGGGGGGSGTTSLPYSNITGTITLTAENISAGTFPSGKFVYTGTATTNALEVNGSALVVNGTTGNIGIGTPSPGQTLTVVGTGNVTSTLWVGSTITGINGLTISAGTISLPASSISQNTINGITIPIANTTGALGQDRVGGITLPVANTTGDIGQNRVGGITLPIANTTGALGQDRVGGITLPSDNVTAGTFPGGKFVFTGTATTNALEVNGTVLVVNGTVGRVGIGTNQPLQNFVVVGTANVTGAFIAHNTKCSAGQVLSTTADGTLTCVTDQTSSGGVTIPLANVTNYNYNVLVNQSNITSGITLPIGNTTGGSSVQCSSTDKLRNITINNGVISGVCDTDQTGAGSATTTLPYANITSKPNNYTIITLLQKGVVGTTNLAGTNFSAFVYDFSDTQLPTYNNVRIGCVASVTGTQVGDINFKVFIGSTALTNKCTITSNSVAVNTATTNYESIPSSSGNTTITLEVNDTVSLDDPIIYGAWLEMKGV